MLTWTDCGYIYLCMLAASYTGFFVNRVRLAYYDKLVG